MGRRRRRRVPQGLFRARIEGLSHDGRGIARMEGKTVFISLALEGEEVLFRYIHRRSTFDEGVAQEILTPSPLRVEPRCPAFGRCGGCALQHMDHPAQLELKQANLLEQLRHFGGVEPEEVMPPITGPLWGYRRSARLGARFVRKRGEVLVGFRERWSGFIVEMAECPILAEPFGRLVMPLRELISGLSVREALPQVELYRGDSGAALVFRHLQPLTELDTAALAEFGEAHGIRIYLQPGGPGTVHLLAGDGPPDLSYRHPAFDVELHFRPGDFIQVNGEVNRRLVQAAVGLLDPDPGATVLDLFCGMGNFSLPLARRAGAVVGMEGNGAMVERAASNARLNGLENCRFQAVDLTQEEAVAAALGAGASLVLLDPPRSGAQEVCRSLAGSGVRRVCYCSCNPATLARDVGILCRGEMRLLKVGIVDMFPHTAHTEALALLGI